MPESFRAYLCYGEKIPLIDILSNYLVYFIEMWIYIFLAIAVTINARPTVSDCVDFLAF